MSVGEMRVMDRTGDSKTVWNSDNPDEVNAARETFNGLRKKGYLAFRVGNDGGKAEAMSEFDPTAEKMILSPALRGG